MSRLDQHVAAVQNRLTLARCISAIMWTLLVFAGLVTIDIVIARAFRIQLPRPTIWFWSGFAGAALTAMIWAYVHRPSPKAAAVAIDQKLGLREKISTAIFIRESTDPFAQAAVRDAELTAQNVIINFYQHFPQRWPKATYGTFAMACAALVAFLFMPQLDLFGREASMKSQQAMDARRVEAKSTVQQALATVEAIPKSMANDEAIKSAKIDLQKLLNQPIKDPQATNRSAFKALQDIQAALKREGEQNARYAQTQDAMRNLSKNVMPSPEEKGPVADAQRKIAEGKFMEAVAKLDEVVKKFDQMDEQQKQQAAQQMAKLAQQLQQAAGNPQQQQQQIAKQLQQQLGMNQQQSQQMAQQMQQAAQGNKQAQQAVQQQAQKMMQQMNNGQGPSQAQQQQMQQMMQQMQAQANSAAQSGQMSQAAQQMAQAMQQAANGKQQANGQQMAQGMGSMQQQLQDMEASAQDAAQVAAAQQQLQNAADQAADGLGNPGDGDGQNGSTAWKDSTTPWQAGDPKGQGAGMGGPGMASGGRAAKDQAPFSMKPEISPSEDNQKGKILASTYIKDNNPIKGETTESIKDVAKAALQDAADEVDNEHISRQSQSAVRKYFQSMIEDGK